ncbi:creatininase family protein [Pedobacter heparinus]|uniref:creatininase family protein n=1 Tax=Pedobacter heparinus TaxID=984 RepID=UPI00292E2EC7|nr:creatininase family protein [Pedobacter heparinus]
MLFSSAGFQSINKCKDHIAILPLGAIEQHGPHLAVSTDSDIVGRLAAAAEQVLPNDILLCPTLFFGSSHHHLPFGGTISLPAEVYTQVIVELVASLLSGGFKRIVLLNGHGGNITPVRQALSILSARYDATMNPNIVLATYWELAGSAFSGDQPMESPALSHACEYETSLMLHLFPEKVFPEHIKRAQRPASNGYIPWEDDEPYKGISMVKQTPYISGNGSSGEPQLASAKKGEHLFTQALTALTAFVKDFKSWPFLNDLSTK